MRKAVFLFAFFLALLGGFLVAFENAPRAQLLTLGAGSKQAAAASYTGPGDTISGWTAFYSTGRAFSAATRGNPIMNVCNVADVACADVSTDATTGIVSLGLIGGSNCSIVACTIKTIYDQSGASACAGVCDVTQATISLRPTLTVSAFNSQPCSTWTGTANAGLATSGSAFTGFTTQPFSSLVIAKRSGAFTTTARTYSLLSGVGGGLYIQTSYRNSTNTWAQSAGTVQTTTASDSNYHIFVGVLNSTSSVIMVDGTDGSAGNAGTNAQTGKQIVLGGDLGATTTLTGDLCEVGFLGSTTSGNRTSITDNANTFW